MPFRREPRAGKLETVKLQPEQLSKLWKDFRENHPIEIRDQLIEHYLYLVKMTVHKLTAGFPSHVIVEDLYSPGVVGLIKAIEKYDPEMKNKFETYAVLVIRGAVLDEIREQDWIPRSVHKKANLVAHAQDFLSQTLGREPSDVEMAAHLHMGRDEFDDILNYIRPAVLVPLNAPAEDEGDGGMLADRIPDLKMRSSYDAADYNEFKKLVEEAVIALPEQEKIVLVLYYYENMMLKEIAQVINVTESRVSQIHTKALLRLRKRLEGIKAEFADIF